MTRSITLAAAAVVVAIACANVRILESAVHGEVNNLIESCGSRLDWIYSTRYPDTSTTNCSGIIKTALAVKDAQTCPAEADLVKCFNVSCPYTTPS